MVDALWDIAFWLVGWVDGWLKLNLRANSYENGLIKSVAETTAFASYGASRYTEKRENEKRGNVNSETR